MTNATTIDLFYDTETGFQWTSEEAYKDGAASKLSKAASEGFEHLKSQAREDHSSLMKRVHLNLGTSGDAAQLPTDSRINSYSTDPDADPEFITLMFQFGRHLLISSSRDYGAESLGVPANLQGIWNDMYSPPWYV